MPSEALGQLLDTLGHVSFFKVEEAVCDEQKASPSQAASPGEQQVASLQEPS